MTWAEKLAHDFEYIADRSLRLYFEIVGACQIARRLVLASRRRRSRRRTAARERMCGICGIVRADGRAVDRGRARAR